MSLLSIRMESRNSLVVYAQNDSLEGLYFLSLSRTNTDALSRDIRGRHEQAHWKKAANEAGKSVAKTAAKGKARPTKKRAASETYDDEEDEEDEPPSKVLRTSKACDRCSKSK